MRRCASYYFMAVVCLSFLYPINWCHPAKYRLSKYFPLKSLSGCKNISNRFRWHSLVPNLRRSFSEGLSSQVKYVTRAIFCMNSIYLTAAYIYHVEVGPYVFNIKPCIYSKICRSNSVICAKKIFGWQNELAYVAEA